MPRRDLIKYPKNLSYKAHIGYVMFILHRITGILLGLYIIMHILGASTILTFFHKFVQISPVRYTIFIIFLFHGLNGLRIIAVDFFNGAERECFYKQNFTVIILFVIIAILGAIPIFI
jgi:succinate dehydrogenase / fumarate reductase cytochrome b subunit